MAKKGYWMAMIDITDPDGYQKYIAANAAAFEKYGAKFLVRGGRSEQLDAPAERRHVVIEFESFEQAVACYNSPEYQAALKLRNLYSTAHFAIVEGV